ncbi:DUF6443 domain-containing protein [Chitinophaga eiseniae]|uniref:DUF6443 domain-containing protein n=1 Tax=Chitinophaga eiseniae TaxID=634771 RepID=A0A847SJS5_9BACT|nr:DUF6443 domain-containing protein [Chitinophaga eiseniae]NLR82131.1 hypothetical protein [Chitinophaga eiseniae]
MYRIPYRIKCVLLSLGGILYITSLFAQNIPDGNVARKSAVPITVPAGYTNTTINYVRVFEPSMPTVDTAAVKAANRTVTEVKQTTQYFDGLGRLLQTVAKGTNPAGSDLVTPVVYDNFGREQYKYLPYVPKTGNTNDGKFKTDPFNSQKAFYQDTVLSPSSKGESIFYSQVDFEPSPLNRVLNAYAPGNSWSKTGGNHPVQQQYLVNGVADSVRIWDMPMGAGLPISTKTYNAGELYKNVTIDESGNQIVEFKDKTDHVVLKKVQVIATPGSAHMGWLCTYYIYDDLGNLRFVMPPLAVENIVGTWNPVNVARELCFQYRYDGRNRMIVKKIPGADSTEMVYDIRDRLVFSRDGNLKASGKWLVSFYDALNRPVETALYASSSTWDALQTSMNAVMNTTGSTSYIFPGIADLVIGVNDRNKYEATKSITFTDGFDTGTSSEIDALINPSANGDTASLVVTNPLPNISNLTPLTYTFYDQYDFAGAQSAVKADSSGLNAGLNPYKEAFVISNMTKGLVTGTKVRVVDTEQWLTATNYYDDKGRTSQVIRDNIAGGQDILSSQYDFSGRVLSTYLNHKNPRSGMVPQVKEQTMMSYDDAGRLVTVKKRYNDADSLERAIAINEYDALGQLKAKRLGIKTKGAGTPVPIERMSYEYNIRGWMKSINKNYLDSKADTAHWGQEFSYDEGFTDTVFNGNIAGIRWKGWNDAVPRAYGYNYDRVSRVTHAEFRQQNSPNTAWVNNPVDFSTNWITYDANGNIRKMAQNGLDGTTSKQVDRLAYTYRSNSNKLAQVYDSSAVLSALGDFKNGTNTGDDYDYDSTGNLIKDLNKGITQISYNHLNLPVLIKINGKGTISYLYDASGNKLRKIVTDSTSSQPKTTTTDYIGAYVYENDTLQFAGHEEGRLRVTCRTGQPASWNYDYFVKDHLGNVRLVLTEQRDQNVYAATMETAMAAKEAVLFSNIDNTRSVKPVGYPADPTTSPNDNVARLNATSGQKIGPSLVLRVIAGDTLQVGSKAFYKSTAANTSATNTAGMLAALLQAFGSGGVSDGVHGATGPGSPLAIMFNNSAYDQLKQKDPNQNLADKPRAYLNYILFDDQFNMVNENSGIKQVQGTPDALQTLATDRMVIKKTGFVYIYTSNESGQDVFFDNLVVAHSTGPVLEETHYYPFGLTMVGISSKALKGTNYSKNKKEYNGIEHTTDLDLNQYDALYRNLDPQIGRWNQIDPKIDEMEAWSPYVSNYNNPISYSDFLGDEPDGDPPTGVRGFLISTAGLINGINNTITLGLYNTPASAFGLEGEDAERYDNMSGVGNIIPILFGPKTSPGNPPVAPVNLKPIRIPVPAPAVPAPILTPIKSAAKKKKGGGMQELMDEIAADKAAKEAKEQKDAHEQAQRQRAGGRSGNSNQTVRGEHNSGGRNAGKHEKANKRRAREQKAADARANRPPAPPASEQPKPPAPTTPGT